MSLKVMICGSMKLIAWIFGRVLSVKGRLLFNEPFFFLFTLLTFLGKAVCIF